MTTTDDLAAARAAHAEAHDRWEEARDAYEAACAELRRCEMACDDKAPMPPTVLDLARDAYDADASTGVIQ